jgi:hypothetical protein
MLVLARRPGAETVALALRSYGVHVESVACASVTGLIRALAGEYVQS